MGLHASIFRSNFPDSSNGGISSKHHSVCIVNAEGPFNPGPENPPVMIVKGNVPNSVKCVPAHNVNDEWKPIPGWWMHGGTYVGTSDSRLGNLVERFAPRESFVSFHDRKE